MADLLKITFFDNKKWSDWMGKARREGVIDAMNALTTDLAGGLAEYARTRMSTILKRGHKFNVGASNRASENFIVAPIKDGNGVSYWGVSTGSLTYANEAIRKGIPKHNAPSIAALKAWASEKGITFESYYDPVLESIKSYQRVSKLGKTHTVRGYIRRKKNEKKKQEDDPFYAIQSTLWAEGTNRKPKPGRKGPNWARLFPVGQGRFDYPTYLMKQDTTFGARADKIIAEGKQIFVEYLATGRKKGGIRGLMTGYGGG